MTRIELQTKRTPSNGTTPVQITNTVAAGTRSAVIAVRYVNNDDIDHTPSIEHDNGTTTEHLKTRPPVPPDGTEDSGWGVSRFEPIHLLPGEELAGVLGEIMSTAEGFWLVTELLTTVTP
jgi:hypothetical protein